MDKQDGLRVTRAKKRLMSEEMESNSRPGTPTRETRSRKNSTSTPDKIVKPLRSTPDPVINSPARRTTRRTSINSNPLAEVAKPTKFATLVEEETTNASSDENKDALKIKEEPVDEVEQRTPDKNNSVQLNSNEHSEMTDKAQIKEQRAESANESNAEENQAKTDQDKMANKKLDNGDEAKVEEPKKEPHESQANEEKETQVATENPDLSPAVNVEGKAVETPKILELVSENASATKKGCVIRLCRFPPISKTQQSDQDNMNRVKNLANGDAEASTDKQTGGVEKRVDAAEVLKELDAPVKDTSGENIFSTVKQNGGKPNDSVVAESNPLKESDILISSETTSGEGKEKFMATTNDSIKDVNNKSPSKNGNTNGLEGHKPLVIEVINLDPLNESVIKRMTTPKKMFDANKSVDGNNDADEEKLVPNKNDTIEDIVNRSLPKEDYTNLSFIEEAGNKSIVGEMPFNQSVISIASSPMEISKKEDRTVSFKFTEKDDEAEKTVYPRTPFTSKIKISINGEDLNESFQSGGNNSLGFNSTLDMMRKEPAPKNTPFRAKLSGEVPSSTPINTGNTASNAEEQLTVDGMSLRSGKKYTSPLSSPIGAYGKGATASLSNKPPSSPSSPAMDDAIHMQPETTSTGKRDVEEEKTGTSPRSSTVPNGVDDNSISKGLAASLLTDNIEKEKTAGTLKNSASPQSSSVTDAANTKKEEEPSVSKPLTFPKTWSHCVEGKCGPESKIDRIKSRSELSQSNIDIIKPLSEQRVRRYESDDNEEESVSEKDVGSLEQEEDMNEENDEEDVEQNSLLDNEAVEMENYCSGDSLAESEKREMEENEICERGESLGSVDTEEESDEEEDSNRDSFIVSDSEDLAEQSRQKKKFRRLKAISESSDNSLSTGNATEDATFTSQTSGREVDDKIFDIASCSSASSSKKEQNNNLSTSLKEENAAKVSRQNSIEERLIYQADSSNETEATTSPQAARKEKHLKSIVTSSSDEDLDSKRTRPFSQSLSFQRQTEYSSSSDDGEQATETKFKMAQTPGLGSKSNSRRNSSLFENRDSTSKDAFVSEQLLKSLSESNRKASPKNNDEGSKEPARRLSKNEISKSPNTSGVKQHTTTVSESDTQEEGILYNSPKSAKSSKTGQESGDSESTKMEVDSTDHSEASEDANPSNSMHGAKKGLTEESDEEEVQSTNTKTKRQSDLSTSLVLPHKADMKANTANKRRSASVFGDCAAGASQSFLEAVQRKIIEARQRDDEEERDDMSKKRKRSSGSFSAQDSSSNAETKPVDPQPHLKKIKTGKSMEQNLDKLQINSLKNILDYCDAVLDANAKAKLEAKLEAQSKNKNMKKKNQKRAQDKPTAEEEGSAIEGEASPPLEPGLQSSDSKQKETAQETDTSTASSQNEKVKAAVEHALKASLKIRLEGLGSKKKVQEVLASLLPVNAEECATENAEGEEASPPKENIVRKIKTTAGTVSEGEISQGAWQQPQPKTTSLPQVPSASGKWLEESADGQKKKTRKIAAASGTWLEELSSPPPVRRIASGARKGPHTLSTVSGLWLDEFAPPPRVKRNKNDVRGGRRKIHSRTGVWRVEPFYAPVRRIASGFRGGPRKISTTAGFWLEESASPELVSRHEAWSPVNCAEPQASSSSKHADTRLKRKRKRVEEPINVPTHPIQKLARVSSEPIDRTSFLCSSLQDGNKPKKQKSWSASEAKPKAVHSEGISSRKIGKRARNAS